MIDWTRIHELRHEIGQDGLGEVVDIFLEEVEETLERLAPLADGPERAACLHFLKGSSLNLGFVELGALCRQAETAPASVSNDQIAAAYRTARDVLLRRIDEGRAPAA